MNSDDSLDLTALRAALRSLNEVLHASPDLKRNVGERVLADSTIQRFEYTYELAWKTIRRTLELMSGAPLDEAGRRELFRIAHEAKLIQDQSVWVGYHRARNMTSHAYDQSVADHVLTVIEPFAKDTQALIDRLEAISPTL